MLVGSIFKSYSPSACELGSRTRSSPISRRESLVIHGLGNCSNSQPNASTALSGTLINESGFSVVSATYRITSRIVTSSGPTSSISEPSRERSLTTRVIAVATSSTYTGATRAVPPLINGTRLNERLSKLAKRFRYLSSAPNMTPGRTMVAFWKAARTASSPAALLRKNSDGELDEAPRADTCTKRSIPRSVHTSAISLAALT
mmetsp:Transcript_8255/g.16534  ORF Transcript_8255/g.16534 Transcript_8255/m.16534 type:complete len:203 (-) Transcript_8255:24-632(-)